jgi:leucyl-tRNA synthetase
VLYDLGLVHTKEPFQKLVNQGLMVSRSYQRSNGIYVPADEVEEKEGNYFLKTTGEPLRSQIDKMSKSKLNGSTPDEVIEEQGADALRLYEMFMGPFDKEKVWNKEAVTGCRRFLNRFWETALSDKVSEEGDEEGLRLAHRLLHSVTADIEELQFNTAIAKMMEFMNGFVKVEKIPKSAVKIALQCLFPFAPHMASELWQKLDFKENINTCPYPEVHRPYLEQSVVTYVVQVNGKVRGRFDLPKDLTEEAILKTAKAHPQIQKYLVEGELKRVIFVPNKLLNLVIG